MKTKVPEMATLSCSDLLTAYRMTQSLNRNKPYKYDPADTMDLHRWSIKQDDCNFYVSCLVML